jgi:cyclase
VRIDRVAEDIYVFVSARYAYVTCTVMLTPEGAIVVDSMPFPVETHEVLSFIESKLGAPRVRYVINTHHHADHTYGNYIFEDAQVIAHDRCRELLARRGAEALERAKQETPSLAEVRLRLPDITFRKELHLHVGHRHLYLFHSPGHTPDGISVFVVEEKVLIAGDAVMPVPHIVEGERTQLAHSLTVAKTLKPSFIVQGHGDVLLRGEINDALDSSISYLDAIARKVQSIVDKGEPPTRLRAIDIEACGKSRIPLDGLVGKLHVDNLRTLYRLFKDKGAGA